MKKYVRCLLLSLALLCVIPCFAAAQISGERIETGRLGAADAEAEAAPAADGWAYGNRWLYLGLRAGPSLGIYIPGNDTAFTGGDSYGASLNGAVQATVEIAPLFSVQAEAVFAWDHGSLWQYTKDKNNANDLISYQYTFKTLSLQFPLLAKLNFHPGTFRVSPFLGAYLIVPLGTIETAGYNETASYDYSYALPLGLLGGLSVEFPLGPGLIFADLRYSADLGEIELQGGDMETYTRHTAALSLGYAFGLFRKR
jgi:hypothetical protein